MSVSVTILKCTNITLFPILKKFQNLKIIKIKNKLKTKNKKIKKK